MFRLVGKCFHELLSKVTNENGNNRMDERAVFVEPCHCEFARACTRAVFICLSKNFQIILMIILMPV